ncbi:hypothetical protein [Novosphingobium sp.]|uniref:hypothetical protein n=1 Tax=Novosphingobium sp. TaxID=1874826 RepID=UPI0025EE8FDA|nr:hypothetical protein [Novosphingobium sp.]
MDDRRYDNAWFAPHRYGFGAGMPIAWQGWLMLITQIVLAGSAVWFLDGNETAQVAALLVIIMVPLPLMIAKTRGGWKWRWGDRE